MNEETINDLRKDDEDESTTLFRLSCFALSSPTPHHSSSSSSSCDPAVFSHPTVYHQEHNNQDEVEEEL